MLLMMGGGSYAATQKISVNMVMGEVYYKRGNAKAKPIRKTSRIKEKDVIRTMVESSVELRLDDGSSLRIEENSVVDLSKMVKDGKITNTKVRIKTGKVLFNVKKLGSKRSDFVFETPTATAAIRGTEGGIGTNGRSTYAYLSEGGLELKPKGGGKAVTIRNLNVAIQEKTGFKVRSVNNADVLKSVVTQIDKIALATDSLNPEDAEAALQALDSIPGLDSLIEVDSAVTPDTTLPADTGAQADTVSIDTNTQVDTTSSAVDSASRDTVSAADTLETAGPDPAVVAMEDTLDASDEDSVLAKMEDTQAAPDTLESSDADGVVEKEVELRLNITSPASGSQITAPQFQVAGKSTPGASIQVFESRTTADASGNWKVSIQSPRQEGDYQLVVEASLGDQTRIQEVGIVRMIPREPLKGNLSKPPANLQTPNVTLRGTCIDGATIEAGGFTTIARGGQWNLPVSWPVQEEGLIEFEVYCSRNDEEISLGEVSLEYIRPSIPLELNLNTPDNLRQTAPELVVRGNVKGQDVLVDVNGSAARVNNGQFSHTLRFSEINWDLETIEVEAGDGEEEILKTIQVEVDRSSPGINTRKPEFVGTPVIENNQAIRFGLKDSPGDEVTVAVLVDGSEEENFTFEGAVSGQNFTLIPGVHDYRIEAADLAGNKVVWERRQVEYYPRAEWRIDLVQPVADRTVLRPPRTQVDADWEPTEDIRIRIQSLPDDDFRYLKEVRIFNQANGAGRIWRDIEIDDIEFEFDDMPLVMNKVNRILIRVEPKNGPIRSKVLTYTLTDGS